MDTNLNPYPFIRKSVNAEVVEGPDGADYIMINGQLAATLFPIEGAPTDPGEFVEWLATVTTARAVTMLQVA
ncbi:MAG: hypothetical protein WD557_01395 [Dehalococcoidia bacterium]